MNKPDRPRNEQQRLATLRSLHLLDSSTEERFDRLTRLAMHVFDVPIALVSLVDGERQWFKSCQGLSVSETERDISFCGHAILGDEAFVVEDTLKDPRFADNPLVCGEPYIRFYAGYPIAYLDGSKLGTLCLIDHQPRQFGQRERLILRDLAKLVESEIQARQLASIDELTGINNRRGLQMLASQALKICHRQRCSAALIFIDLDDFKTINDRLGHAEGDAVLRVVADCLARSCRESDLVARLGGDEFVMLLINDGPQVVEAVMARFATLVEQKNRSVDEYQIAYSYGVVHYDPEQHRSLADLLAEGDELMYARKQAQAD